MTVPTIAVVNDDTAFLNLMHELLTDEGYETIIWIESEKAYDMIRRVKPDLVILDIRMGHPEAGWALLDLIRLDPDTAGIPVIISSADSRFLREKAELLREKGCEILEKPFNLEDLLTKVRAVVGPAVHRPSGEK